MASYTKIIGYSLELFQEMNSQANDLDPRSIPQLRLNLDGPLRFYHGTLTKLAKKLGFSKSQVYNSSGLLYRTQAITKLSQSNPTDDGWWLINFEPTQKQLEEYFEQARTTSRKIAPNRMDVILSEIAELRARVVDLENAVARSSSNDIRGGTSLS